MMAQSAEKTKEGAALKVKVFRYSPDVQGDQRYDTYDVPYKEGRSVMNVLQFIYENVDQSICFYAPCRIGKCFGCHVKVDGKTRLACTEIAPDKDFQIDPMSPRAMIRDVVCDRSHLVSQEEEVLEKKAKTYLERRAAGGSIAAAEQEGVEEGE